MDASKVLPNELWIQILSSLEKYELKALRLAGERHLCSLSVSLLFTTAYIAARKGVLETFTTLTTHPVFREYVREVVFDSSFFKPELLPQYAEQKCGPALTAMFGEQEHIQKNELFDRVDDAFKCLSHIRKVVYADMSRTSYLPGDLNDPSWGYDFLDGPLIRRSETPKFVENIECCNYTGEYECRSCPFHSNWFRRQYGSLIVLMQVLKKHSADKLVELSLGNNLLAYKADGIAHLFFNSNASHEIIHPFTTVIRGLRKLELTISRFPPIDISPSRIFIPDPELQNALMLAEGLEELTISGGHTAWLYMTAVFGTAIWSKLRFLKLVYFDGIIDDLEDLLCRHASTLFQAIIDQFDSRGSDPDWARLGENIQKRAPKLKLILGGMLIPPVPDGYVAVDLAHALPLRDAGLNPFGHEYISIEDQGLDWRDHGEEAWIDKEEDESASDNLDYSSDDAVTEDDTMVSEASPDDPDDPDL